MTCEDYFEDPEKNAAHLESCEFCRAMAAGDAPVVVHRPLNVESLPLASWEEASHRTWPLVTIGAAAVLILVVVLFLAAGVPPLRGVAAAAASSLTSFEAATKFFQLFGSGLRSAPAVVHVTVGVLFVVINTLLFLLLRRAPKGIDV